MSPNQGQQKYTVQLKEVNGIKSYKHLTIHCTNDHCLCPSVVIQHWSPCKRPWDPQHWSPCKRYTDRWGLSPFFSSGVSSSGVKLWESLTFSGREILPLVKIWWRKPPLSEILATLMTNLPKWCHRAGGPRCFLIDCDWDSWNKLRYYKFSFTCPHFT